VVEWKYFHTTTLSYGFLIKKNKHSIGIEYAPNMDVIEDFWYKESIMHVIDLIEDRRHHDLCQPLQP
jgi:hypothetical protein